MVFRNVLNEMFYLDGYISNKLYLKKFLYILIV